MNPSGITSVGIFTSSRQRVLWQRVQVKCTCEERQYLRHALPSSISWSSPFSRKSVSARKIVDLSTVSSPCSMSFREKAPPMRQISLKISMRMAVRFTPAPDRIVSIWSIVNLGL